MEMCNFYGSPRKGRIVMSGLAEWVTVAFHANNNNSQTAEIKELQ